VSAPISEGTLSAQRILRAIDVAYLRWALRSIHPLHPDVPLIVRMLNARRAL
jgi:hypothetical protein